MIKLKFIRKMADSYLYQILHVSLLTINKWILRFDIIYFTIGSQSKRINLNKQTYQSRFIVEYGIKEIIITIQAYLI